MSVQWYIVSFIQKQNGLQLNTGLLFENMYFYCLYSIKTKISSMLCTGYFLKIQKLIGSKNIQSVLIAEISSHKTQKITNPQNFRVTRYVYTIPDTFSCRYEKLAYIVWTPIGYVTLEEIGAAQLRFITLTAPKWPFTCVNRSPVQYGFRVGAKAILYGVKIALISFFALMS